MVITQIRQGSFDTISIDIWCLNNGATFISDDLFWYFFCHCRTIHRNTVFAAQYTEIQFSTMWKELCFWGLEEENGKSCLIALILPWITINYLDSNCQNFPPRGQMNTKEFSNDFLIRIFCCFPFCLINWKPKINIYGDVLYQVFYTVDKFQHFMFEFDNDTKEKNFSSNLALVELLVLCLWFCTRSHFYSLKTMSQIKLCKMEIYATWRIVQTRTNNDFGNCTGTDFSFDTNKDIFLLSIIWLWRQTSHMWTNTTMSWRDAKAAQTKKVWFACSEKDNGPQKWLLCTCGEKVQRVWQIPNCCMHRSLWFCSDFLFLSLLVFVCGCVTFHLLFETVQIVKAKAVAFHFDGNIWLMSS